MPDWMEGVVQGDVPAHLAPLSGSSSEAPAAAAFTEVADDPLKTAATQ